jgi:predicted DCC family thiol-disulfide oxidoreductase YuxK
VEAWTKGRVDVRPWQHSAQIMAGLGLTAEDGMRQVWYVDENGRLSCGAEAVNNVIRLVWWARPLTFLYRLSGFRQLQDRLYRWVADNRHRMPGGTAECAVELEVKE